MRLEDKLKYVNCLSVKGNISSKMYQQYELSLIMQIQTCDTALLSSFI